MKSIWENLWSIVWNYESSDEMHYIKPGMAFNIRQAAERGERLEQEVLERKKAEDKAWTTYYNAILLLQAEEPGVPQVVIERAKWAYERHYYEAHPLEVNPYPIQSIDEQT